MDPDDISGTKGECEMFAACSASDLTVQKFRSFSSNGWLFLAILGLFVPSAPAQEPVRGVQLSSPLANGDILRKHKDYALLLATGKYEDDGWPSLANPIQDAKDLAAQLEQHYGFQKPEVLENPRKNDILSKLREYSLKHFDEGDQLFIFFAGHGLYDEVVHQGFIVAADSRADDATRASYVSYADLRERIDGIKVKHILLVIDACQSGTFDPGFERAATRGRDSYEDSSLPDLFSARSRWTTRKVLASAGDKEVYDGDPGHNSPFAARLLDLFRSGDQKGFLTFSDLLSSVSRLPQTPVGGKWGSDDAGSEFFFVSHHLAANLANSGPEPATIGPSTERQQVRGGTRPAIAVLGFENLAGREKDDLLSTQLSEALITALSAGELLRPIDGEDVDRVRQEMRLKPQRGGYSLERLARIRAVLQCDYVVSGSYTSELGKLHVDFRLQNAINGEIISVPGDARPGEVPAIVMQVGSTLRQKLGIQIPTHEETKAVQSSLPTSSDFSDGMVKLRSWDLGHARDAFERAARIDSGSPFVHEELAKVLSELGYDEQAKTESSKADALAGGLPAEQRQVIRALSERLSGKVIDAIESYRALRKFFPDERDYSLQLASLQIHAGMPGDALVTLDALRQADGGASSDPRVYIQEAMAASSLSDPDRRYRAASRAAELANREGAPILAAEAYWQKCEALLALGNQKGAEEACHQAHDNSDSVGARQIRARSLNSLASVYEAEGRAPEALGLRQDVLGLQRSIGSRKDILGALINLASLKISEGQLDEALVDFQEAMHLQQEISDKEQLALLQLNWGNALYAKGDYTAAKEKYEDAFHSAESSGDKVNAAQAAYVLSTILLQVGDIGNARKRIDQILNMPVVAGLEDTRAMCLNTLGDILLIQNSIPEATKAYAAAEEGFAKLHEQPKIAAARLSRANLLLESGRNREAEQLARELVQEFQREKDVDSEVSSRDVLARALFGQTRTAEALGEIEIAAKLSPRDQSIRISVDIDLAKLKAESGRSAEGRRMLRTSLDEAKRANLVVQQFEIRLAEAEIDAASGDPVARDRVETLENDASRSGYLLIAAKASRLRAAWTRSRADATRSK
jgi:tetratricopeptide (TPR) repeat protein/TolB-like protein